VSQRVIGDDFVYIPDILGGNTGVTLKMTIPHQVRAGQPLRCLWRNSGAIFSRTQRIDCMFLTSYLTLR
jgi:hypothetical protein